MHKSSTNGIRLTLLILGVAVGLATLGCYVRVAGPGYGVEAGAEYEVEGPPPPPQEEVVVATPGPDYIWIGGFWDWDIGVRHFVWRSGHWERPPHPEAHWIAPRYELRNGHHFFHRGHWEHPERH